MSQPQRFRVVGEEEGLTLRALLTRRLQRERSAVTELIKAGGVYVNRLRIRIPSTRVAEGERITVYAEAASFERLDPQELQILWRDEHCVILNKSSGVPVSATRQSARGTLSQALVDRLHSEGVRRPYVGLVHRLDREASGLVLFTIRSAVNKSLHQLFEQHEIERSYLLRCAGPGPSGACELPLRHRGSPGRETIEVAEPGQVGAREARTDFTPLGSPAAPWADHLADGDVVVRAELATGRTHQIRVHCQALGAPIHGDRRYGGRPGASLCLHAQTLRFAHPISGAKIEVEATVPAWAELAAPRDKRLS